jgi:hypothetical protein
MERVDPRGPGPVRSSTKGGVCSQHARYVKVSYPNSRDAKFVNVIIVDFPHMACLVWDIIPKPYGSTYHYQTVTNMA